LVTWVTTLVRAEAAALAREMATAWLEALAWTLMIEDSGIGEAVRVPGRLEVPRLASVSETTLVAVMSRA
jgi:hypothetical protein